MKTVKFLMIVALVAMLAAGCAPISEDVQGEGCETTDVSSSNGAEQVPSYTDDATTGEAVVTPAPAAVAQMQPIYFDFDQHTLTMQAREILDGNTAYLQANPDVKVVISGNCDERGSDEYNLALGERRAVAARDYLVSMGIAAERLSTISYGEEKPADTAHTEAAWALNRRAEFAQ